VRARTPVLKGGVGEKMRKDGIKKNRKNSGQGAQFRCGGCGRPAATATLLLPGQPDPRLTPEPEDVPSGAGTIFIELPRLSIDGGPMSYTIGVSDDKVERVKAALLAGSAADLYAVDREFAPFWCPLCQCCYCRKHYAVIPAQNAVLYSKTYGTCPHGHGRMLCD
jgi:hypothetical protein